jgi:pterin-4a-carbinolamine dehydratase
MSHFLRDAFVMQDKLKTVTLAVSLHRLQKWELPSSKKYRYRHTRHYRDTYRFVSTTTGLARQAEGQKHGNKIETSAKRDVKQREEYPKIYN